MKINFDIDKIVKYLEKHKSNLPTLYEWKAKIDKLVELDTLTKQHITDFNELTSYKKELKLKEIVGEKLRNTFETDTDLFNKLCLWIIKDWGGINSPNDSDTLILVHKYLETEKPDFNRIASTSKVGAYMFPEKNAIYDSRVAYSLNWIILSQNAGKYYFPIPEGRNSKMSAFDLNVLIRLKNISNYKPTNLEQLKNRGFISNADKNIFIDNKDAYFELNKLIKAISKQLWLGDNEKEQNLYYTEMLLFSMADREIIMDIASYYSS